MQGGEGSGKRTSAGRVLEAQAWAVCKGPGESGCLLCVRGKNRILAGLKYYRRKDRVIGKQVLPLGNSKELQGIRCRDKDERPLRTLQARLRPGVVFSPYSPWGLSGGCSCLLYLGPLCPGTQSSEENTAPKNPSPDHGPGPGLGLHHLKLSPILHPQPPSSQQVVT